MGGVFILFLFVFVGVTSGWLGSELLPNEIFRNIEGIEIRRGLTVIIGGFTGLFAGVTFQQLRIYLTNKIRTMPTDLLISRSVGLIVGLLLANLLLAPILLLPLPFEMVFVKPISAVISNLFFGIVGFNLADTHGRTLLRLFNPNSTEALLVADGILTPATAKILDTSVIIDGRVNGLLSCGILEGQIIVAQTVIEELHTLSDSSNSEKRAKGRRGLKLLKELREAYGRRLVINSTKYEGNGTDDRLLKLTSDTGGKLITADFNLSEIAKVQDLKVLNLSDLVLALRPDIQPGEKLILKIVRPGKENSQGIGYLEDGTMVVIEDANNSIGQKKAIVVTGALQTSTGRMIFGQLEKDHSLD